MVGPALRDLAEQVRDLPAASRSMTLHGLVRTAVFQDKGYAARYLAASSASPTSTRTPTATPS